LKNSKKIISLLFAGILAFGVTVSATHMHLDDFSDVQTEHIVSADELFCAICGSLFKFTPDYQSAVLYQHSPDPYYFGAATESAIVPFSRYQQGRSPPLLN
jgi:hypothetical protein